MKIVVIGGRGRIGSKLVTRLAADGCDVVAADVATGVDTITGAGLAEVLAGAAVVVDASDAPSFEEAPAREFFTTATTNLLKAEATAGVRHHVGLSVVNADRLAEGGYFRAKLAQEQLVVDGPVPYTMVHATQFFEFVETIAAFGTNGTTVTLAPLLLRPVAADDVAAMLARVAVGAPVNGIVEVAGPEELGLDELVRRRLAAADDPREVVTDPAAGYIGLQVAHRALLPAEGATIGPTRFDDWLARTADAGGEPDLLAPRVEVVATVPAPPLPDDAEVMTILVTLPAGSPGGSPHRHPGPAFGYVTKGAMRFELEGEPERVVQAGEAFWEPGGDVIHLQDANALADAETAFVVTLIVPAGQPVHIPVDASELEARRAPRAPRP